MRAREFLMRLMLSMGDTQAKACRGSGPLPLRLASRPRNSQPRDHMHQPVACRPPAVLPSSIQCSVKVVGWSCGLHVVIRFASTNPLGAPLENLLALPEATIGLRPAVVRTIMKNRLGVPSGSNAHAGPRPQDSFFAFLSSSCDATSIVLLMLCTLVGLVHMQ